MPALRSRGHPQERIGPRKVEIGCRDCGRTFSARTGTVRHYSHRDGPTRAPSIKLMFQGLSLPVIVKRMDISLPTAFAWRHRVPTAMSRMPGPRLSGTVEVDGRCFRLSSSPDISTDDVAWGRIP